MHLFDIDIPGKITFKESECLSPGDKITTFDAYNHTIGLGICYDVRFPELANIYRKKGIFYNQIRCRYIFETRRLDNENYVQFYFK